MLTRIYGKFVFECDACGETLETNTKDFNEARDAMRAAKWTALQVGSDWVHTCAGCQDRSAKERPRAARREDPVNRWTPDRIEHLRHLREVKKLIWRDVGDKMGIKGDTACAAYIYYCDPEKRRKRKIDRAAKPKPEKRISMASPSALGPDDLPIKTGGRVPDRVARDLAISRPNAPPPSPSARRYNSALADDIRSRIETQGATAGLFGDPPKGRSALDRKRAGIDA